MHECAVAAKKYRERKLPSPEVPLQHIQEQYKLERYTVSRNAIQLAEGGVQRINPRTGKTVVSKGRGWIKSDEVKDSPDMRVKAVYLTKRGMDAITLLFPQW